MTDLGRRMVLRALTRRPGRSAVTCAAVALAVAALVVLASIMVGVTDTMIANSVALHSGHVLAKLSPERPIDPVQLERIRDLPGVRSVLARRELTGTLRRASRETPALVAAVSPNEARRESAAAAKLTAGEFLPARGTIVLGAGLADAIGAALGQSVDFTAPHGPTQTFRVAGVFRTGLDALDDRTAYVSLADAPGPGGQVAVYLANPDAADARAANVRRILLDATVFTWRGALPELDQLTALNTVSMNIVLALALLILALGVSNTAFLSAAQRTREIGILKTLGMSPGRIMAGILAEMLLLACLGGLIGMALGAALTAAWARAGLDLAAWTSANRHFLVSSVVHPRLTWYSLLPPGLVALACGALAGLAPAWRAARINVVAALRWI